MVKYEDLVEKVSKAKFVGESEKNIDAAILALSISECENGVNSGSVSVEVEAIPKDLYAAVAARYFVGDSGWEYLGFKYLYDNFTGNDATLVILGTKESLDEFENLSTDQDIIICKRKH